MATLSGITTNGLVFAFDMLSDRSFKGAPTRNHSEQANANRDQTTFNSYSGAVSGGRWSTNHQDAIEVFNRGGSNISSKINSGTANYKQTYHGIWTFEEDLGYPVVTMRDIGDGSWLYAGFGLNSAVNTPTKLGLGLGDNYVMSWDQWTTDTGKSANCGLYGQNTTNTSNNFHDGLSNTSGTGKKFNTKTHTWERLWCVFTISANRGLNATWSQYNYGMYGGRGILKVANWQLETGDTPSKFVFPTDTTYYADRSTTEAILDLKGKSTITESNLSYSIDNTTDLYLPERFTFDNALNSKLNVAVDTTANIGAGAPMSFSGWVKVKSSQNNSFPYIVHWGSSCIIHVSQTPGTNPYLAFNAYTAAGLKQLTFSTFFSGEQDTNWVHFACTWDGTSGQKIYKNGVEVASTTQTASTTTATGSTAAIGSNTSDNTRNFNGDIGAVQVYDRVLTPGEVKQNFEASRVLYGV